MIFDPFWINFNYFRQKMDVTVINKSLIIHKNDCRVISWLYSRRSEET